MTPYEINVMLHYYARAQDHPDIERDPPIWRPTVKAFLDAGLLVYVPEPDREGMTYGITLRGRAYVEALQSVPLPEQHWIVHWPGTDYINPRASDPLRLWTRDVVVRTLEDRERDRQREDEEV